MLNNTKTISVVMATLFVALTWGSAAQAEFDRTSGQGAKPLASQTSTLAALKLRPSYDMLRPVIDSTITASIAPTIETTTPVRRSAPDYNVFKSVVVPVGKLPAFAQWSKVKPSAGTVADFCAGSFCDTAAGRKLAAAAEQARGLSQVEALKLINREVNRTIAYRSDKADIWQTLAQSAARGAGDCEDFAIAKMELLTRLGFSPEQLQFIVLKDTRRQLYHAVLAVHVGGKRYILDNLNNTAASDDIFRTYKPIASFVGGKSYVHGFRGGETAVAVGAGGYGTIQLGERN